MTASPLPPYGSYGWEFDAPPFGDLAAADGCQKHRCHLSVTVNANSKRFGRIVRQSVRKNNDTK